jgi:hypothetical protein
VSPTATGNGIDVPTEEAGIEAEAEGTGWEAAGAGDEDGRAPPPLPVTLLPVAAAVADTECAGLLPVSTLGTVLLGEPLHPVRAMTAAPARMAQIRPCLVMWLPFVPRPGAPQYGPVCDKSSRNAVDAPGSGQTAINIRQTRD